MQIKYMAEKYLIVKGCAGLGNRISTLCSAIEYAKETNRTLLVDWSDGEVVQEGYNFFNDYFQLRDVSHITSYDPILNREDLSFYPNVMGRDITASTYRLFDEVFLNLFPRLPFHRMPRNRIRTYRRHWRVKPAGTAKNARERFFLLDDRVVPFGGDMSKRLEHDVVFYLDFIPAFSRATMQRHIVLKDKLRHRIGHFLRHELDGGRAVGVHIRATDKKPEGALERLFDRLKTMNQQDTKIFLSTDNVDIQQDLIRRFDQIKVFPKDLPRVAAGGIHQWAVRNNDHDRAREVLESSIIDMYLLSACEYLLFQGNSSFSRIAALLHGENEKAIDWNATRVFQN